MADSAEHCGHRYPPADRELKRAAYALLRADNADDDEGVAAIIGGASCAGCLARAVARYATVAGITVLLDPGEGEEGEQVWDRAVRRLDRQLRDTLSGRLPGEAGGGE